MPVQQSAQQTFTLIVEGPLQITTTGLAAAVAGQSYNQTLSATGGNPPYSWSATGLPTGLTCSAAGVISGTPSASGSFSIVVTVVDTPQ